MNKEDITTPISNKLTGLKNHDFYTGSYMTLCIFARKFAGSPVKFHKEQLGKQKYCWTGEYKNWVWESENWRVYVNNTQGISFEVLETLNSTEAVEAWYDYLNSVATGVTNA